jgi:hypothetical protein
LTRQAWASAMARQARIIPCMAARGFHSQVIYQPATRFWAFQGIEAGIFVVLAAALIALTWRLVLTRDA